MRTHIRRAMDNLQKKFLEEAELVEASVEKGVKSLLQRDKSVVDLLKKADDKIDMMEVTLEEECLRTIALYQPVAIDLRVISAVLKINNDLERIADLAVNISKDVARMSDDYEIPFDFTEMADKTLEMFKLSLQAMIELDSNQSKRVCELDDNVDEIKLIAIKRIAKSITDNPEKSEDMLHAIAIAGRLERIADLSTNIAEEVIYIVDGIVIRHRMNI